MEEKAINDEIGKKIRNIRISLGMSQEYVGKALGVTFQQIQKYEKGENRISASRLFHLSNIFKVDISAFFEDLKVDRLHLSEEQLVYSFDDNDLYNKETIALIKAYSSINSQDLRKKILSLMKSIN